MVRKLSLRMVSMLLVLTMLMGMIYIPANAEAENMVHVNDNGITMEGSNSLGNLLADSINEQNEQMDSETDGFGGYSVSDVVVIGNTATVEYYAMEDAWVFVSISSEYETGMKASGYQLATAENDSVAVTLEGDMPEYFLVEVYMLSQLDFSPLCKPYTSTMYTFSMQELLGFTVDDFAPDRVLNFDNHKENNFAVYRSDVVVIGYEEGKNIVTAVDDENGIYVIENATDVFKNMYYWTIFSYRYSENEYLIASVKDIAVDGDTVTITAGELDVEHVFAYVKIDTTVYTDDTEMDMSGSAAGFDYLGKTECTTYGKNEDESEAETFKTGLKFSYSDQLVGDDNINVKVTASFAMELEVAFQYYYSFMRDYLMMKLETKVSVKGTFSATGAIGCKLPVGKAIFSIFGIVGIGLDVDFTPKISGSVSAVFSYEVKFGMIFEADDGAKRCDGYYDPGEAEVKSEVSVKAFLGFEIKPNVEVGWGLLAYGELKAKLGFELSLKQTVEPETTESIQHECLVCASGKLSFKFSLSYEMKLLDSEKFKLEGTFVELEYKISDVYLSLDPLAFGFGKCPNISYKTQILLVDREGNPIPDVTVSANVETAVTDENGLATFMLAPGTYLFMAGVGEEIAKLTTYVESARTIKLRVKTNYTGQFEGFDNTIGNIMDSIHVGTCGDLLWTLLDGVLTISGDGEMPDYYFYENYEAYPAPWYDARSEITKIVISEGVTSVGEYAFIFCDSVTNVEIADTVTDIGQYAFCGTNLTALDLPENLRNLGHLAFSDVPDLESITIESSNEYYFVSGNCLISYAGELVLGCKNSVIPDDGSVKVIGTGAFEGSNITSIVIPDSVTKIQIWAFGGCGFVENLTIGAGVQRIETGAFVCAEIYAEESGVDKNAGLGTYTGLNGGTHETKISVSADNLNYYSAGNCIIEKATQTVVVGCNDSTIPNDGSILTIGKMAFYKAVPHTLIIPEGVTVIGAWAFVGAAGTNSKVVVAASVKEIQSYAFGECGIDYFVFKGEAPEMENKIFGGWPGFVSYIYYPEGNDTWTEDIRDWLIEPLWYSYKTEWIPYEPGTMPIEIPTSAAIRANKDGATTFGFIGGDLSREEYWDYVEHYAEYDHLVPGEEYLLLVLADIQAENILAHQNILYIEQATADDWGELYFDYTVPEELDPMFVILCGPTGRAITDAIVTYEGEYDGQMHIIDPIVMYNGKRLEEGKDYVLMGDVMYQEAGEYTFYVCGINNYSGELACTYIIENIVASGTCGYELYWSLDGDGVLTISGSGSMTDYGEYGNGEAAPWADYADQITALNIADTVTSIGHEAFRGCTALTTLDMPVGVQRLGLWAFADCTGLTTLIIGADCYAASVYELTFENCVNLTDVYLHQKKIAESENLGYISFILAFEYAQRVYVVSSLESVSAVISQYFACTDPAETVEVDGVSYRMFTRGTHSWETSVVEPTCITDGTATYLCAECGYTFDESIDLTGHDWDSEYVCRNCAEAPEYVTECGLELDSLVVVDGAYYTADGRPVVIAVAAPLYDWMFGNCLRDYVDAYGERYFSLTYWENLLAAMNDSGFVPLTEETLVWILDLITGNPAWGGTVDEMTHYMGLHILREPACEHQYESVVTAPTCTEQGYTTHTCAACGDSYVDSYVDAVGHSYGQWYTVTEATCTDDGVVRHDCANCDQYETDVIGAMGHDYETVVTAPTCTEQGYTTHTCAACGDSYVDSHVDAVGHSYGQWYTVTEATCTDDGLVRRDCANCDHYETDVVGATGHDYETVVIAPTCTEKGSTTYTCHCGHTYVEEIPATGHEYVDGECIHCGEDEVQTLLGDVNGDGKVTTADARMILLYIVGKAEAGAFNELVADVNGDGNITTADARVILLIIVGKN